MATRSTVHVPRIELTRRAPMVRCTYAGSDQERWTYQHQSCGALIPFKPQKPCPECGNKQIRPHAPPPDEDDRVITGPAAIIDADTGEPVVIHWTGATNVANALAPKLAHVHWSDQTYANVTTTTRLSGLAVTHRTFGFQPPAVIRKRYGCSRSLFNSEYPEAFQELENFVSLAEWVFRTHAPEVHKRTGEAVRAVVPNPWRMVGTLWTSGIINQTAALPYHRDSANVPGSWSAMLCARHMVDGGYLHLADYDTFLAVPNGSITIFDGQSVVHGVTPLFPRGPNAYRYTCVTYSKSAMGKCCDDPADEIRRAKLAATEAEDRRIR